MVAAGEKLTLIVSYMVKLFQVKLAKVDANDEAKYMNLSNCDLTENLSILLNASFKVIKWKCFRKVSCLLFLIAPPI
jgi:hypothetical protein